MGTTAKIPTRKNKNVRANALAIDTSAIFDQRRPHFHAYTSNATERAEVATNKPTKNQVDVIVAGL
jgi:hypothetical protein